MFPLRTPVGDGVTAAVDAPFATLVLAAASPRGVLCLSPREQDRLRVVMETGRRCDEILDPCEDPTDRVRCIQSPRRLILLQAGVALVVARAALMEVLRANTFGVEGSAA